MSLLTLAETVIVNSGSGGVSGEGIVGALIWLVCMGLILWLIWWFIGYVGLPEPFNRVARVLIGLVALIFLINLILGFAGHNFIRW